MADHPDPDYECINDPACKNWWDGYYSPSHSVRCHKRNQDAKHERESAGEPDA